MHLQISYIFAVFTYRNRIFFLYSIATTTSVLLYLSLGGSMLGLYRCWCYWSLVIKAISIIGKNLLLFSISRTFFGKFTVWETICSWLLFSLHPTATPVLTKQQVSYCLHELFWLNSIVLPDALDIFHHSSCYYLGAHPSRVWCAR